MNFGSHQFHVAVLLMVFVLNTMSASFAMSCPCDEMPASDHVPSKMACHDEGDDDNEPMVEEQGDCSCDYCGVAHHFSALPSLFANYYSLPNGHDASYLLARITAPPDKITHPPKTLS